jgi:lysophospholipase L1-like esterase
MSEPVKPALLIEHRFRRVWLWLVVGLVLIAGALAVRWFWFARPEGIGPAGPVVDRQPFARPWTTRKVLLLGVGDSITAGYGVPREHAYVARLAANPADELADMRSLCLSAVLPQLRIENLALSGSTSLDHLRIVGERLGPQGPDTLGLVVMTSGGNDLIHSYGRAPPREGAMYGATLGEAGPWIAAYEKRLKAMISLLRQQFPGGCHIFLGDIYDPTDGTGKALGTGLPDWPDGAAIHRAYNEVIHRVCATDPHVHLVPLWDEFLGHGVHCTQFWLPHYRRNDPHYWYGVNLEDPNDRGYDAVRRLFLREIAKIADQLRQ